MRSPVAFDLNLYNMFSLCAHVALRQLCFISVSKQRIDYSMKGLWVLKHHPMACIGHDAE